MSIGLQYPHIEKPTDGPAHLQRVPRVRVAQIAMDHLAHGWSAEEISRQHPYLLIAEIHAALLYYYDHLQEIEQEIHTEWDEYQRLRAGAVSSPFAARMRAQEPL